MTPVVSTSLITKGIFGVGVVAIAGIIGAVHFASAQTNNNSSGYGTTSSTAVAAANTFEDSLASSTVTFDDQITTAENNLDASLVNTSGMSVTTFNSEFNTDTLAYANTVGSAFDTFRSQVMADANTATSKDQFIDQFNNAKATYLNSLDAAKNQLADAINQLGGNSNAVAKDQFMDIFNSDRDAYSNALEGYKNTFAATIG
jgi:hypothetical protein